MIGKRLVALAVALVMIGASLAVRAAFFDDGDGGGNGNAGGGNRRDARRLACITELAPVCDAIASASKGDITVTVEPAGTTADKFVKATSASRAPYDGWLTLAPWPDIVTTRRTLGALDAVFDAPTAAIARSKLVIAIRSDRRAVLERACGGTIDWTCVGNHAGKPWSTLPGGGATWGTVEPAHAQPVSSAVGALVLAQAAGSYLATPQVPIAQVSSNDWQLGEKATEFPGWFQTLETSVPSDAFDPGIDLVKRWQQFGLATFSLVGTVEADLLADTGRKRNVDVIYPATVSTADVVFAPVRGTSRDLAAAVTANRRAYLDAGWQVGRSLGTAPASVPPLPKGNGLPSGGTIAALQDYWSKVVR